MQASLTHSISFYVGIDVSKEWLDCWLLPGNIGRQVPNTSQGYSQLAEWLRKQGAVPANSVLCVENTGVYDDWLVATLTEWGWPCALEKTTIREKVAPEHHRKEDLYDAWLIAEYARRFSDQLQLQQPTEQVLDELKQLYSERNRLTRQLAATKTKGKQAPYHRANPQILQDSRQRQYEFYKQEIRRLEEAIQSLIAGHSGLNYYYQLLKGIPGVGEVTAWLWLSLFYGCTQLRAKHICSRFGFAPHGRESGKTIRGKTRSSGHGQAEIRRCMAMAANSVTITHEHYKTYKYRKMKENKPWPVVRNNIINKLIHTICSIWNTGIPYDPEHVSRFEYQKAYQST